MADRERRGLRATLRELLGRRNERLALVFIGITATIASFAEVLILVVISLAALRLSDNSAVELPFGIPIDELGPRLLLLFGLFVLVVRLVALLANSYVAARLAASVIYRWRRRVFVAYQRATWETQSSLDQGYLQTLSQTHVNRLNAAVQQLSKTVTAGTSFLTFVFGAFVVSPIGALGLVVFGVVVFVLLRPLTSLIRGFASSSRAASKEYARQLEEAASLSLEHRVLGAREAVAGRLSVQLQKFTRALRHQLTLQSATPQVYTGVGYLAILGGLAVAQQVALGDVAVLGAIVLLMLRSLRYGQTFQSTSQAVAAAQPFLIEVLDAVDMLEGNEQAFGDLDEGSPATLEFDAVGLGHQGRAVVSDVSLVIEQGSSVGIIGPSGGGKSTMALTLSGLLRPVAGRFLINGVDSKEYAERWWHRHVSFVPQQPMLFDATVAENIAIHREGIALADIDVAAREAHLSGEIEAWDEGLEYRVGPRGSRLSGGQRQRICIARALVGRPEVLILDEPTSALDAQAEDSITEVLRELRNSCTMIVVAHRLSTLEFCDRVFLVDEGRVVELGSGADVQNQKDLQRQIAEAMSRTV